MHGRHRPENLTSADASNLVVDAPDQVNVFLAAGFLGPGGFVSPDGVADLALLRETIGRRLHDPAAQGLRRFSQRIITRRRRLMWSPCPVDLSWHIRELEHVPGRDGLAALCATLMTTPLPADRPMWELLVVPGASAIGPGIVLRVHHAVADGVVGVRLAQELFDPATYPEPLRPASAPEVHPTLRRRLTTSLTRMSAMVRATVPSTVLLGPIGPHRAVAMADVDLTEFKRGAATAGGTVNDALLAAVAEAATATLRAAGQPVPPTLPASVPVALPKHGGSGNAVGVMLVQLPTHISDTTARVRHIARLTIAAKDEARAQGTYELTRTRWGSKLFAALARHQRFIALLVTNVRGPVRTMQLAGAPLVQAWSVTPIQGNVRLGISALSYSGRLNCAAHLDADALDPAVLQQALASELDRIAQLE